MSCRLRLGHLDEMRSQHVEQQRDEAVSKEACRIAAGGRLGWRLDEEVASPVDELVYAGRESVCREKG